MAASFIMPWEGLVNRAYLDPIGIPTACYGFTAGVQLGQIYTDEECKHLLNVEIAKADAALQRLVTVPMPDTRRAAYISFIYNVGEGNFSRSTLLRKTNAGDVVGACNEFLRWSYAGGKKLAGLVKRREAERKLCLKGISDEL
jgi:lysozyme